MLDQNPLQTQKKLALKPSLRGTFFCESSRPFILCCCTGRSRKISEFKPKITCQFFSCRIQQKNMITNWIMDAHQDLGDALRTGTGWIGLLQARPGGVRRVRVRLPENPETLEFLKRWWGETPAEGKGSLQGVETTHHLKKTPPIWQKIFRIRTSFEHRFFSKSKWHSSWKVMVGTRILSFWGFGLFSGAIPISFRDGIFKYVYIDYNKLPLMAEILHQLRLVVCSHYLDTRFHTSQVVQDFFYQQYHSNRILLECHIWAFKLLIRYTNRFDKGRRCMPLLF